MIPAVTASTSHESRQHTCIPRIQLSNAGGTKLTLIAPLQSIRKILIRLDLPAPIDPALQSLALIHVHLGGSIALEKVLVGQLLAAQLVQLESPLADDFGRLRRDAVALADGGAARVGEGARQRSAARRDGRRLVVVVVVEERAELGGGEGRRGKRPGFPGEKDAR